jgi:hypothetical protein
VSTLVTEARESGNERLPEIDEHQHFRCHCHTTLQRSTFGNPARGAVAQHPKTEEHLPYKKP